MTSRLPASERRAVVLDTACRVFCRATYRSATTAEIAREAGVTEPIIYRHFASKRLLYLACVEEEWRRVRRATDAAPAGGRAALERETESLAKLWAQLLAEANADPELRAFLRRHLREVHVVVSRVLGSPAEARAFIAGRLLGDIAP